MSYQPSDRQFSRPAWPSSWPLDQPQPEEQQHYVSPDSNDPHHVLLQSQSATPIVYQPHPFQNVYPSRGGVSATSNMCQRLSNDMDIDRPLVASPAFALSSQHKTVETHTPQATQLIAPQPRYPTEMPYQQSQTPQYSHISIAPSPLPPSLPMTPTPTAVRPTLSRHNLSMSSIHSQSTYSPPRRPIAFCTDDDPDRSTYELLALTDAYLRSTQGDNTIDTFDPLSCDFLIPHYPAPLSIPHIDTSRLSVESDSFSFSSFSSGSSCASPAAGGHDVRMLAQGSQVGADASHPLTNGTSDVQVEKAPGTANSVKMESPSSSFHSSLVSVPSSPMPPPTPEIPLMNSTSSASLQCACNEVKVCKAAGEMHSAGAGETRTDSGLAESGGDLPAKVTTTEAPAVAVVHHPAASRSKPRSRKMDPLTVDEIDEIADEWSLPPDPATVAKTRTRKQQLTARAPPSSRVPSHFKKSTRPSTASSHTPSKTPSPQPSSLAQTRTPSPAEHLPPPVVVDTTLSSTLPPLISAIPLPPIPSLPSPPKPVQARRTVNRATKPAPVVARASPARSVASSSSAPMLNPSHPATGRPSKACIFCRRRKIGCTQSETSPDSCQQCLDRHITCEYPPDVQMNALHHASSTGSLVVRRPRRENRRETPV